MVNVYVFTTNYLGREARADTGGTSVRGLITQIVEHLGLGFNLAEDQLVEGKSKIDMDALCIKA